LRRDRNQSLTPKKKGNRLRPNLGGRKKEEKTREKVCCWTSGEEQKRKRSAWGIKKDIPKRGGIGNLEKEGSRECNKGVQHSLKV